MSHKQCLFVVFVCLFVVFCLLVCCVRCVCLLVCLFVCLLVCCVCLFVRCGNSSQSLCIEGVHVCHCIIATVAMPPSWKVFNETSSLYLTTVLACAPKLVVPYSCAGLCS